VGNKGYSVGIGQARQESIRAAASQDRGAIAPRVGAATRHDWVSSRGQSQREPVDGSGAQRSSPGWISHWLSRRPGGPSLARFLLKSIFFRPWRPILNSPRLPAKRLPFTRPADSTLPLSPTALPSRASPTGAVGGPGPSCSVRGRF